MVVPFGLCMLPSVTKTAIADFKVNAATGAWQADSGGQEMMMRWMALMAFCLLGIAVGVADDAPQRIKPDEARKFVDKKVEVVFEVKHAKHSEKRKTVFLDSEEDFRSSRNIGISIVEKGLADLKMKKSIGKPEEYYANKKIRVTGTVVIREENAYIDVDAADQIDLAP